MNSRLKITILFLVILLSTLWACDRATPTVTPHPVATDTPAPVEPVVELPIEPTALSKPVEPTALPEGASPVLISEILAGIPGNNTLEFIELYNRSSQPVDLLGWALWYRLPSSTENLFIYRWQKNAVIPPFGHYLLTFRGIEIVLDEVSVTADSAYDQQSLNTSTGGLQLRKMDGTVMDALGWGEKIDGFVEGEPAPKMVNGLALERNPGGEDGNGQDSDDNAADFSLIENPNPQNSGSPITPLPAERLELVIEAPETAAPGDSFDYFVTVTNLTGQDLQNISVIIPIPEEFSPETQPMVWDIADLSINGSANTQIPVEVPFTYFDAKLRNAYVQAENWDAPGYAAPVITRIEGGSVPIAAARALPDADLTIEGVATMYTGGYFAGDGNVKFYLADGSAGLQVQVFGGDGVVRVKIGDRVRVSGQMGIYRDSLQIVPYDPATDVVVLASGEGPSPEGEPLPISLEVAVTDVEEVPGRLVQVEGMVVRVEEFTYSYEIDLADEAGNILTLYVDKQTNVNVEAVENGMNYRAVGILERRDGENFLYPRIQDDLEEIFPPVLRLTADGPITRQNNVVTYTLTAFNHTPDPFSNVIITATQPLFTSIFSVDGGERIENTAVWMLPELPPGENASVTLVVNVVPGYDGPVVLEASLASADQWPEAVTAEKVQTFAGSTVPVWAIQGDSYRSPLIFKQIATQGVVTGVFPELGGFFIQGESDDDTNTSDGLFVSTGSLDLDILAGDEVNLEGTIREISGQTTMVLASAANFEVFARGKPLPDAVELDPPADVADSRVYYESLEGMLTQVTGPAVVVAPTTQYGEYVLVRPEHGVERLFQGEDDHNGIAIMVDDGSSATYTDRSQMAYAVAVGDQVSALIGPLAFTYDRYKLEPVVIPSIQVSESTPGELPSVTGDQFSIMTWNVENFFDTKPPHPSDPPLPTREQYETELAKIANTIEAAGAPDIVALQEVENIDVLNDISAQDVLVGYDYQSVLVEGFDSRGIDVGYLIRGDRVEILDVQQREAPEGLTSRPPLIIKLSVETTDGQVTLYVINNHFLSMSGGVEATEPRRLAQAEWNLTLVQEIQSYDPGALVAVVGDLNSYLHSPPIDALRQGGLTHIFDLCPVDLNASDRVCPQGRPYTYIYEGESQVLDHILITPELQAMLDQVLLLHVNADFPLPYPDDTSPTHKSDHDPVLAIFSSK